MLARDLSVTHRASRRASRRASWVGRRRAALALLAVLGLPVVLGMAVRASESPHRPPSFAAAARRPGVAHRPAGRRRSATVGLGGLAADDGSATVVYADASTLVYRTETPGSATGDATPGMALAGATACSARAGLDQVRHRTVTLSFRRDSARAVARSGYTLWRQTTDSVAAPILRGVRRDHGRPFLQYRYEFSSAGIDSVTVLPESLLPVGQRDAGAGIDVRALRTVEWRFLLAPAGRAPATSVTSATSPTSPTSPTSSPSSPPAASAASDTERVDMIVALPHDRHLDRRDCIVPPDDDAPELAEWRPSDHAGAAAIAVRRVSFGVRHS